MTVRRTGCTNRAMRWESETPEGVVKYHPSKRAATYWLKYGKTFKTNPVYAVVGGRRSQKRIR